MRTIRNGITRILNGLAGISFLAMVVLTCWQVFTRYILQNPSTWSEELVGYLFAWMSLFGVCIVTRERGHMNIPILVDKLGTSGKKIMNCLGEVIAFLFSAIILVFGGYQIVIFYIILPLCGVLNMIYIVMNVIDILKESPDEEEVV